MPYKLVAVDIDGTLLNSKSLLTDKTRSAIVAAVSQGVIFTISSGRPMQGLLNINSLFDVDLPFITYNGAVVVMGKSGRELYKKELDGGMALEVLECGVKHNSTVVAWVAGGLYVSRMDEWVKNYQKLSGAEIKLIADTKQLFKNGVTKIVWIDEPKNVEMLQPKMQAHFGDRLNCHASSVDLLEFVDKDASKAIAMAKIGEIYNIDQSEMIAIGDGHNDISMIKYAGMGVAMGNARQAVKDVADFITLTNDEDGVAHVIEKFVLMGQQ